MRKNVDAGSAVTSKFWLSDSRGAKDGVGRKANAVLTPAKTGELRGNKKDGTMEKELVL